MSVCHFANTYTYYTSQTRNRSPSQSPESEWSVFCPKRAHSDSALRPLNNLNATHNNHGVVSGLWKSFAVNNWGENSVFAMFRTRAHTHTQTLFAGTVHSACCVICRLPFIESNISPIELSYHFTRSPVFSQPANRDPQAFLHLNCVENCIGFWLYIHSYNLCQANVIVLSHISTTHTNSQIDNQQQRECLKYISQASFRVFAVRIASTHNNNLCVLFIREQPLCACPCVCVCLCVSERPCVP